mgnify:CR=1 FL=1
MIKLHGNESYTVVLLHGGPGAPGSLESAAAELSKRLGVIEHLQTQYSIDELISELHNDLENFRDCPLTLIGHSWGAWLSILYAAKYSEDVKQLILVGCPPFEKRYIPLILEKRLSRLSLHDKDHFIRWLEEIDGGSISDEDFKNLQSLLDETENCQTESNEHLEFDSLMYAKIWEEAESLRDSNALSSILSSINVPVCLIHGDCDPHPISGVIEPLKSRNVNFELHLLSKCGHYPFREKYAKDEFYRIINDAVNSS